MNKHEQSFGYTATAYNTHRKETYEAHAKATHEKESAARIGKCRIQPDDIRYIENLVNAPDVNMIIDLI